MASLPERRGRRSTPPVYSTAEEIAHSLTHGIGALLAVGGLVALAARAALYGQYQHLLACSVFGVAMLLTYVASTIYHSIPIALLPNAKNVLRAVDQSFVYVLIAGTYTPFCLLVLEEPLGLPIFIATWTVALGAIALRTFKADTHERFALWLYLGMGWGMLPLFGVLSHSMPAMGFRLLVIGGAAYTLGVVFYRQTKMRYHHAIWHLFTLIGSACHYFAVLLYVIPARSP